LGGRTNKGFRNDVVDITDKAALLAIDLLEMPFGALGAPFLEKFANTLDTTAHRFDRLSGITIAIAVHSDLSDAQVYADHPFANGFWNFCLYHDVEEEGTFVEAQICRAGFPIGIPLAVVRNMEGYRSATTDGGERSGACGEGDPIRASIVADGTNIGVRAGNLASLFMTLLHGFEGFGGFHPRGDDQLGRQAVKALA